VDWLRRLRSVYLTGMLGGTHHEVYPRVGRGSRKNFLYFTLAAALNFQRASEGLWRSALATYTDPQTHFVFLPEHVGRGADDYRAALTRHGLGLQPAPATHHWVPLSCTLHDELRTQPRCL